MEIMKLQPLYGAAFIYTKVRKSKHIWQYDYMAACHRRTVVRKQHEYSLILIQPIMMD